MKPATLSETSARAVEIIDESDPAKPYADIHVGSESWIPRVCETLIIAWAYKTNCSCCTPVPARTEDLST